MALRFVDVFDTTRRIPSNGTAHTDVVITTGRYDTMMTWHMSRSRKCIATEGENLTGFWHALLVNAGTFEEPVVQLV